MNVQVITEPPTVVIVAELVPYVGVPLSHVTPVKFHSGVATSTSSVSVTDVPGVNGITAEEAPSAT